MLVVLALEERDVDEDLVLWFGERIFWGLD